MKVTIELSAAEIGGLRMLNKAHEEGTPLKDYLFGMEPKMPAYWWDEGDVIALLARKVVEAKRRKRKPK